MVQGSKFSSYLLSLGLAFAAACLMIPPVRRPSSGPPHTLTSLCRSAGSSRSSSQDPVKARANSTCPVFFLCAPDADAPPRQLNDGFLEVTNVTSSVAGANRPRTHVRSVLRAHGDPGYLLASVMISEAALAILLSHAELPDAAKEGGVLTPASALGDVLVQRLQDSGRFEFESEVILGQDEESRKSR